MQDGSIRLVLVRTLVAANPQEWLDTGLSLMQLREFEK